MTTTIMDDQRNPDPHYLVSPFTILIDQREQAPFTFQNITSDSASGSLPIAVLSRSELLATGDYTIEGYADQLTIERKSVADLIGTLTAGRERFEAELQRAASMRAAFVVCEGGWPEITAHLRDAASKPGRRPIAPKSITGSIIAWQQRYPAIHWWFCDSRRMAEVITFRIMERFWNERMLELRQLRQLVETRGE